MEKVSRGILRLFFLIKISGTITIMIINVNGWVFWCDEKVEKKEVFI